LRKKLAKCPISFPNPKIFHDELPCLVANRERRSQQESWIAMELWKLIPYTRIMIWETFPFFPPEVQKLVIFRCSLWFPGTAIVRAGLQPWTERHWHRTQDSDKKNNLDVLGSSPLEDISRCVKKCVLGPVSFLFRDI
jgi:hypothetical protein